MELNQQLNQQRGELTRFAQILCVALSITGLTACGSDSSEG